jgi:hypothetical protein
MARLAPSLINLFDELNLRWPHRDHKSDGWIGDKAHQARQSDHNPDSRGIVHAIDIDADGIDTGLVVGMTARLDRATEYVIFNRWIYSRSRDFEPKRYTGSNPHTGHIHVSIRYGNGYEGAEWHWGLAIPGGDSSTIVPVGPTEEMTDWRAYINRTGDEFTGAATSLAHAIQAINGQLV